MFFLVSLIKSMFMDIHLRRQLAQDLLELNKRIDKAEEDIRNGRYKTSEELLKKFSLPH